MSQTFDRIAASPYRNLMWAVVAAVLLGQLAAIYLLCSQQVNQARTRQATLQVQRVAVGHCLQSSSEASSGSCARQLALANTEGAFRDAGVVTVSRRADGVGLARSAIAAPLPLSLGGR